MIGPEGDLTDLGCEKHAARLELIQPFLKPEELEAFKHMHYRYCPAPALPLLWCTLCNLARPAFCVQTDSSLRSAYSLRCNLLIGL